MSSPVVTGTSSASPVEQTALGEFLERLSGSGRCIKFAFAASTALLLLNTFVSGIVAIAMIFVATSVGAYFTVIGPLFLLSLILLAIMLISMYKITHPSQNTPISN
ncbi:hypothetical protein CPK_ORF00880 [Chlamydia pneumoniae LPCoLN]|uniref:hypothetical protein n=1 Tax=Chlamydia pneumoniae TaxID=83558 RepID=UPI0001BD9C1F|nr:hypothetical protein [Chlamydia pneumoniae]ACZ33347.1 hypothetical protein CPK_ORF00880 [Chlamydia pneumoniae LPCoLN]ETR80260.1 hypothetical protein X556_0417 [Chlamydia pneumoniae B21]